MAEKPLPIKQKMFIQEYLVDLNMTQAALRAGYSPKTAQEISVKLMKIPRIKAEIDKAMGNRMERLGLNQDRVLDELWNVVTADTNDLMELRRRCCRHCWGRDFGYQMTTNEQKLRRESYATAVQQAAIEGKTIAPFDTLGGTGFNKTRDPHPACPECSGEGVIDAFFKDTRKLPRNVRSLYAGVKITKDGIEIKTHSKEKYIELLGKHMGMFTDKVEHTGPGGTPINVIFNIPRPPKDA